jgi:hypothetical protein
VIANRRLKRNRAAMKAGLFLPVQTQLIALAILRCRFMLWVKYQGMFQSSNYRSLLPL